MKIYTNGRAYYTQEAFLSMARTEGYYIIVSSPGFHNEKGSYGTEIITCEDGFTYRAFRPEDLTDEEILYLLTHSNGGIISCPKWTEYFFGSDYKPSVAWTSEIDVKE